jgi:uncharacterized RDD family membrane protein YckC
LRQIEINTTQNVTIQYELANLRDRGLALILDWLIIFFGGGLVILIISFSLAFLGVRDETLGYTISIVWIAIFFFYTLVCEVFFNGQTIGKMALGMKVVKLTGKQPNFSDYALRWAFRPIDIYFSICSIGAIMISSTEYAQRLGDLLANTTLAKKETTFKLSLRELLRIGKKENYEPTFPVAVKLSENDMLFVKETIDKYRKYKDEVHRKAIIQLSNKLSEVLEIAKENKPKDHLKFLEMLLKDYIILTR